MLRRTLRLLFFSALLSACGAGPSEEAVAAREMAEPYLEPLATYDRWARRLSIGDVGFRSEAALNEAAFAPLRRERRVVAAWLDRVGPDARSLRYPDDAPPRPDGGWVRFVTEDLGELDGQRAELSVGDRSGEFVLLRRTRDAPGSARLEVTLAFAPTPGEAED